jgi:hypothetical protein
MVRVREVKDGKNGGSDDGEDLVVSQSRAGNRSIADSKGVLAVVGVSLGAVFMFGSREFAYGAVAAAVVVGFAAPSLVNTVDAWVHRMLRMQLTIFDAEVQFHSSEIHVLRLDIPFDCKLHLHADIKSDVPIDINWLNKEETEEFTARVANPLNRRFQAKNALSCSGLKAPSFQGDAAVEAGSYALVFRTAPKGIFSALADCMVKVHVSGAVSAE